MRRGERGAALLLVILLVALLAVLVVEFQREARMEAGAAENLRDDLQCHALLRSGSELAEQVLAVYSAQGLGDLRSASTSVEGADLLWQFLFEREVVALPVPSTVIVGEATLRAQLDDLWGKFPLGALVGDNTDPRRTLFRYYLEAVKEYVGSLGGEALKDADTDRIADAILEQLDAAADPKAPLGSLLDLEAGDALPAGALKALLPYLDARTEWKFSANGRCIPLIMTMQGKTVEEAREIADALRDDPVQEDGGISGNAQFGNLDPEFDNSLAVKSRRFQVVLEAAVRGGARRARAVFARPDPASGAGEGRFRLEEWVEGWVEGLEESAPPAGEGTQ